MVATTISDWFKILQNWAQFYLIREKSFQKITVIMPKLLQVSLIQYWPTQTWLAYSKWIFIIYRRNISNREIFKMREDDDTSR